MIKVLRVVGLFVLCIFALSITTVLDIIAIILFFLTKEKISRKFIWLYLPITTTIFIFQGLPNSSSREIAAHIVGAVLHGLVSVGIVFLGLKFIDPFRKNSSKPLNEENSTQQSSPQTIVSTPSEQKQASLINNQPALPSEKPIDTQNK